MIKKIITSIIAILLVLIPIQVKASELEGKVTGLSSGDQAPYSGVLLDPIAASKMLVDQKYLKSEIELSLRKEFQQELASKRLAYDLLKVEHDSLQSLHNSLMQIKEKQISDLQTSLREESSDNSHWWMTAGLGVGIVLSIAVFYASVEVAKK